MKILILSLLMSFNSFASIDQYFLSEDARSACVEMVSTGSKHTSFIATSRDRVYFAVNKKPLSELLVRGIDSSLRKRYQYEYPIADIKVSDNDLIVLTTQELYVYDILTFETKLKIRTLPVGLNYYQYGTAFAVEKLYETYYIAHGNHGVIRFNEKTMLFDKTLPVDVPQAEDSFSSMVTGLAIRGEKVFLAYDDYTLSNLGKAFEGIIYYDLRNEETLKITPVNQRREAYHLPRITLDSDNLMVSSLHLNFKHTIKKVLSGKYMAPNRRYYLYSFGTLFGKTLIQNNKMYGCFYNESAGDMITAGKINL